MDVDDIAIAGLYRAATGEEPWTRALQRVTEGLEGLGSQFVCIDNRAGGLSFSRTCESIPVEAELEYIQRYHALDPRIPHLLAAAPGSWLYCQDLFDDKVAEDQPYYRDLLIPYGGRYSATMKVAENPAETILIALLSKRQSGPFTDRQKAFVSRMGGHLVEAISRFRRVSALATGSLVGEALIRRMDKPVFLLGQDRRITSMNDAAASLVSEEGAPLHVRSERLFAHDAEIDRVLDAEALALSRPQTVPSTDLALSFESRWRDRWAALTVARLWPDQTMRAFGNIGQLLVTVHKRRAARAPSPALWQAAFGLTPAEVKVACALWSGHPIKEAASRLGIATSTARSQLLAIFRKTETRKQSDLVQVLASVADGTERS